MSEYQYVGFRAIEKPVSSADLEFMRSQSSRAEVTPWTFDNEYHFGSFRGNSQEMLRRGYDIHFHFANFGIRKLQIRFPSCLHDDPAMKPYFADGLLEFLKDKQGEGGTLSIEPYHESGDFDYITDVEEFIDRLAPLRAEILDGDLRPLYLAHLAMCYDHENDPDDTTEAPVPVGLENLTRAQQTLAELYGLSDSLIAAAAEGVPKLASKPAEDQFAPWIRSLPQSTKDQWLTSLMSGSQENVKSEIRCAFRKDRQQPAWPCVLKGRTITELMNAEEEIHQAAVAKAASDAAKQRAKKLAKIAEDPSALLRETVELAKKRSTDNYIKIAKILSEVREALAGTKQAGLAERHAQLLKAEHPTLRSLHSELRKQGLL